MSATQRGAQHLADTQKWLAWQRDHVYKLAAQLARAWDCRLKKAA